jgi:hypothetical protein
MIIISTEDKLYQADYTGPLGDFLEHILGRRKVAIPYPSETDPLNVLADMKKRYPNEIIQLDPVQFGG